jgi:large subunit ribosomal protein L32
MAVPKRKMSKSKTRSRRASAWTLDPSPRSVCPRCSSIRKPHTVCANCGWYNGRQAIDVE